MHLEFGVSDHLDRGHRTLREVYDLRLKLVQRYDQAGFFGFHMAEHHATPLSGAPSPNIFMAALSQVTSRIHLAPLVYVLPLYNPLRLLEEICMLDHMTGGRLGIGVGKGIAPFELVGWGMNPTEALEMYKEILDVLLIGLTSESKTITYRGHHFRYTDVPIELEPLQRPHPPLWYGLWKDPEAAVWPAKTGCNVSGIIGSAAIRPLYDRFKEEWAKHQGAKPLPKIGLSRSVIVAETYEAAYERAKRAQASFWVSLDHLWQRWGAKNAHFPGDFETAIKREMFVIGTPAQVREQLEEQAHRAGNNYQICRFAMGDLTDEELDESTMLFIEEVMPHLQSKTATPKAAE